MKHLLCLLTMLGCATVVSAQEQVIGQQFVLGSAPCVFSTGSGAPSSGNTCDHYRDTSTGDVYDRKSGVWLKVGSVAYGGTGVATFTTNGVLYGNGTTSVLVTSQGPTNSVLTASAGAPVFSATPTVTSLTATSSVTTPAIGAAANLTLNPTGDIVLAPTGVDVLPGTGYTVNLGALNNKYLSAHIAELWSETLVAQNTLATIGGRVLVGPTNILAVDAGTGATTLTFKYNNFANGDRIYFEANGAIEFMAVTSSAGGSAGAYTYTVTRNLDGSGANAWSAGDAAFDTGTTGNGFLDLYSTSGVLSGSGPTIVGNVRTGTTYNNIAPRWAIGNLNGLYGYGSTTFGAAFGDASTANVTIDATNGLRIRNGAIDLLKADISGNLKIGNPSGNRLAWDGTNLTVVSQNLTIDSTGITLTPQSGVYDQSGAFHFTTSGTGRLGVFAVDNGAVREVDLSAIQPTNTIGASAFVGVGVGGYLGSLHGLLIQIASGGTDATFTIGGSADAITLGGPVTVNASLGLPASGFNFTADTDTFIDNDSTNRIRFAAGNVKIFWDGTQFFPENDGTKNLGASSFRWNTVYATNGTINTSDARQKTAIRDTIYGRDFLLALRPVDYQWRNAAFGAGVYQGFLAQDVATVAPNFGGLHYGSDGVADGLTYTAFIAPLVAGYQDLAARVRALERKYEK